jgi:hypothetical protein
VCIGVVEAQGADHGGEQLDHDDGEVDARDVDGEGQWR